MPHKILIVDDEPFMLRLIQHHLENAGYEMIKARNGREAVEAATRENPCLVVMDAMMPNMDGLSALRQLKQEPSTRAIPVIMLTANPHKYTREEAESSGAAIFLTKPFSPTQLLEEIRKHTLGIDMPQH
ncbi:MAG: two-component system response regulator [Verrucomicrobia bacterium]|nr:MAG: two-component system response regulator [Verrucomicrobiota bacterium]PYJ95944.1 MAG: two-component system response regulator [Verrucomicrobiota bacterium]